MKTFFYRILPKLGVAEWIAIAFSVGLLIPLPLLLMPTVHTAGIRNGEYLALMFAIVLLYRSGRGNVIETLSGPIRDSVWYWVYGLALVSVVVCSLLLMSSGHLDGVDFSIYYQMVYNTFNLADPTYSAVCDCHHFGVHPSYVVFPMVPLVRMWDSPLIGQMVTSLFIWLFAYTAAYFARLKNVPPLVAFFAFFAALTNTWTGSILNHGFRIEVFYPLFGMLFLMAWNRGHLRSILFTTLLWLSIKEDGPLYLVAFCIGQLLLDRSRYRDAGVVCLISVAVYFVNTKLVQPHFLALDSKQQPFYFLRFWGAYGHNWGEVIQTILREPLRAMHDIWISSWHKFYGSALFLSLSSIPGIIFSLPTAVLFGTATGDSFMKDYSFYYPVVLLPFVIYFVLVSPDHGLVRLWVPKRWQPMLVGLALLFFSINEQGYQKYYRPDFTLVSSMDELTRSFSPSQSQPMRVCADSELIPLLPLSWSVGLINQSCTADAESLIIFRRIPHEGAGTIDPVPESISMGRHAVKFPGDIIAYKRLN